MNLREARRQIVGLSKVEPPIRSSALYETEPVDCEPSAQKFLNAVVECGYAQRPHELLERLREIEVALGRQNEPERNRSRTIDLDLLYFGELGELESDLPGLTLPHPRLHLRRFVLQPLADLRPDLRLPNQIETVAELLASLPARPAVVRFETQW